MTKKNNELINIFLYNKKFKKLFFKKNYSLVIFLNNNNILNLLLHFKLSLLSYYSILVDSFGYNCYSKKNFNILIKNIYLLKNNTEITITSLVNKKTKSCDFIFLNLNWMEREISELLGISFLMKNDSRNLLLQYFDSSSPLNKHISSIGDFELFYNLFSNSIIKLKTITS